MRAKTDRPSTLEKFISNIQRRFKKGQKGNKGRITTSREQRIHTGYVCMYIVTLAEEFWKKNMTEELYDIHNVTQ